MSDLIDVCEWSVTQGAKASRAFGIFAVDNTVAIANVNEYIEQIIWLTQAFWVWRLLINMEYCVNTAFFM